MSGTSSIKNVFLELSRDIGMQHFVTEPVPKTKAFFLQWTQESGVPVTDQHLGAFRVVRRQIRT